jgi:hypothetical protein
MVNRIIYSSRNRITGEPHQVAAAIESILLTSRRNNQRLHVTGALLFNGYAFAQVLEGPREAVDAMYASICKDARHSHIVLLEQSDIPARDFSNWSMAYSGPEQAATLYQSIQFDKCQIDPLGVAAQSLSVMKSVVDAHA